MKITQPLITLSFPRQATIMALCSEYAYLDGKEGKKAFKELGFDSEFIDHKGSQAYFLKNKDDMIFVCRGTEPTEFKDIAADLNALPTKSATNTGLVHKGFKKSADNVFPALEPLINKYGKSRSIYVTGHSLGAAMATLVAYRIERTESMPNVEGLFTYGSPRVGLRKYIKSITNSGIIHYRFVNNNDAVTKVPPFPYWHFDDLTYINHYGQVREWSMWQRVKDRFRGMWQGIKNREFFDSFRDHSITKYREHLTVWADETDAKFAEELKAMKK